MIIHNVVQNTIAWHVLRTGKPTASCFDQLLTPKTLKPAKTAARELFPELAADPLALAAAIRQRFRNEAVVVTDGAAGCAIDSAAYRGIVPACSAKVIDSTGAGDAFLGGLLVARQSGADWQECGRFANACGAACVEQMGAFPEDPHVARERVKHFYEQSGGGSIVDFKTWPASIKRMSTYSMRQAIRKSCTCKCTVRSRCVCPKAIPLIVISRT